MVLTLAHASGDTRGKASRYLRIWDRQRHPNKPSISNSDCLSHQLGWRRYKLGSEKTMSIKVFIACVWAAGLLVLLTVLGSRSEESSIEIWMWTAGITGLCWIIAKLIRDRADDED